MTDVHDNIAEAAKFYSPHRLCEEITNHLVCWTVVNGDVLALDHVPDEEISDVHVTGATATVRPPVQLQKHSACVVLVERGRLEGVPLRLKKIPSSHDCGHGFVQHNHLCFRRACGINILCFGRAIDHSFSECHVYFRVALHVGVHWERTINELMVLIKVIGFSGKTQEHRFSNVFNCSS